MRKSFGRGALGSKAQEMLGIGANSKSKVLQVQRQGFLLKKPFSSMRGSWQKRYFVLKDSFLFWYSSKPSTPFDTNPQGCLPLGGCSVFPMGKEKDGGFVFEVSHPDFGGNVLQLKSKDKAEVDDWIKVLQSCSKATWNNAMLGDALLQKLKHAGTAAEKEKDLALQQAQRNAEEVTATREEKLKLMERQLAQQREYEAELLEEKQRAAQLETDLAKTDQELDDERREQAEELARAEELERKLDEAYEAISSLEQAVERRQRTDLPGLAPNPELQEHIDTIKTFMAGRLGTGAQLTSSEEDEDEDEEEDYPESEEA